MDSENMTFCKLLVLYMLDTAEFPLIGAQISEFILGREYAEFLTLSEAEGELLEAGLIRQNDEESSYHRTAFEITEEGQNTIDLFRNRIGRRIRVEVDEYFREHSLELRNETSVYGDYYKSSDGEYEVRLEIREKGSSLVDLKLTVPTESLAESVCEKWKEKNAQVYAFLAKELL
ncbi:MAG: DUF4364 family protein [Lachnospiraceae bacterium]|nr:DUF4364 family protein [Lachnospiraceae bacterium]